MNTIFDRVRGVLFVVAITSAVLWFVFLSIVTVPFDRAPYSK